ncbi:hypothetical protein K0M31_002192 [Melipona bicolor]|uniref:Uncharacterized protein n=1 Tax=Melipona bicolor TaxID=60889 RepID=A0AA40GH04_9HYME|nr:hypothetical protein K0M31_002192 [Melipona bicolor]
MLEFHEKPGRQTKVQRELKRRWRGRRSNSDENGVKHGRGHDKEDEWWKRRGNC